VIWDNGVVSQLPLPPGQTLGDANSVNASTVAVGPVGASSSCWRTDTHTWCHTHPDVYAYGYTDPHSNTDTYSNSNANTYSNYYSFADANRDAET
jgi:hypothetical protein